VSDGTALPGDKKGALKQGVLEELRSALGREPNEPEYMARLRHRLLEAIEATIRG
jgi:hypothetical protein